MGFFILGMCGIWLIYLFNRYILGDSSGPP